MTNTEYDLIYTRNNLNYRAVSDTEEQVDIILDILKQYGFVLDIQKSKRNKDYVIFINGYNEIHLRIYNNGTNKFESYDIELKHLVVLPKDIIDLLNEFEK